MTDLRNFRPLPVTRELILAASERLLLQRVPYVWGGKSLDPAKPLGLHPGGLDCSGFITWLLYSCTSGRVDVRDTHNAARLAMECSQVRAEDLEPGDLVFYGDGHHVGHVMLHIGDRVVRGQAIGGPANEDAELSRKLGLVTMQLRLAYRPDVLGFGRLNWAPSTPKGTT